MVIKFREWQRQRLHIEKENDSLCINFPLRQEEIVTDHAYSPELVKTLQGESKLYGRPMSLEISYRSMHMMECKTKLIGEVATLNQELLQSFPNRNEKESESSIHENESRTSVFQIIRISISIHLTSFGRPEA